MDSPAATVDALIARYYRQSDPADRTAMRQCVQRAIARGRKLKRRK